MTVGRQDGDFGDLERRLRDGRTKPSELLQQTVLQLATPSGGYGRTRSRTALAGVLTVLTLLVVAALGATNSAGGNAPASGKTQGQGGASDSQYDEKVIICHRPNGSVGGVTLRLSREGAKNHLKNHEHDEPGPCNGG